MRPLSRAGWTCLLLFALAALPSRGHAQALTGADAGLRGGTGLGWAMVVPDALVGMGAFHVFPGVGWGVMVDAKLTTGSKEGERYFLADWKVADLEVQLPPDRRDNIRTYEEWLFVGGSLIRPLSRDLAIMAGGGMVRRNVIREYYDGTVSAPSPDGFYFVKDERDSGWFANASAGVLLRAGQSLAWSVGFEARAQSFSVGVFWMFR